MNRVRRSRRTLDIWPGFVDALATLLMVVIFVLLVFVAAQFFLSNALSGSEGVNAALSHKLAILAEQLTTEQSAEDGLRSALSGQAARVQALTNERDQLSHDLASRLSEKATLENQLVQSNQALSEATVELDKTKETAASQEAALSQQIESLRDQLGQIAAALEASQKANTDQKVQIDDLGAKLNIALASKVEELKQYRSEFFGKLRKALGDRPGIRIDGDRFILQSELLFDTGSAELGPNGVKQVDQLAASIKELERDIPKDVSWVLRVDGHTDKRPITNGKFPSNWELSTERATNVVRELIAKGVPPDHLAAAGFGAFQPLDPADDDAAYAKNRRIELRLDQR